MRTAAVFAIFFAGAIASAQPHHPVLLGGKPFPTVERFVPPLPTPLRTIAFTPGADLQKALCALAAGDQLRVPAGVYKGALVIDGKCRDGTRENPIQVLFEARTSMGPLTIRRSHWHFSAPTAPMSIERGSFVTIDGARIAPGNAIGVRIGKGSRHVTISNSIIARGNSAAVEVEGGAAEIALTNNRLHYNHGGVVVKGANRVTLTGNTVHHDGVAGIRIEKANGVRVSDNTLYQSPRGIELEDARDVVIRTNQLSHHDVALAIGRVDDSAHPANDVTIDRNHIETASATGTGVAIEAGSNIRFANNVIDGYADAVLLLGLRPSLSGVTVANNLILGVTRTAFAIRDRATTVLFDFNVFSSVTAAVEVDVHGATSPLAAFLERGTMPNTRMARVMIFDRDLARLGGVETVDRGTAVAGLRFDGKSPDLGVADR